jgi:hypothetical protein
VSAPDEQTAATLRAAFFCAFATIANQIAGKAVRDSLFLSQFSIESLPRMVVVAAFVSLIAVLLAGRLLRSHGPARLVPWAFAVCAASLVVQAICNTWQPRLVAVVLYLHVAVFGAILVSWFWSLLNERFDARFSSCTVIRFLCCTIFRFSCRIKIRFSCGESKNASKFSRFYGREEAGLDWTGAASTHSSRGRTRIKARAATPSGAGGLDAGGVPRRFGCHRLRPQVCIPWNLTKGLTT